MNPRSAEAGMVSVIVPTKDCADSLRPCLESLRNQDHKLFEIIVVDNFSKDDTQRVAAELADMVLLMGPERSSQRNLGAASSRGEYLIFVDSDMTAESTLFSDVATTFRAQPELDALIIPELVKGTGFWSQCRKLEKSLYVGTTIEAARAFRRVAFDEMNGYDAKIHAGGEDWDLPERILNAGGVIGRSRATLTHDEGRISLRKDVRKKFYYGRSIRLYAARHPGRASQKLVRTPLLNALKQIHVRPAIVLGMFLMKIAEMIGLTAGVLFAFVRPHPADG